jgi:LEA14-like dessication related protein
MCGKANNIWHLRCYLTTLWSKWLELLQPINFWLFRYSQSISLSFWPFAVIVDRPEWIIERNLAQEYGLMIGVPTMFKYIVRVAIALLLLGCVGCAMHDDAIAPEFTVSDLQFGQMTVFETSATVQIRVDNPNPFPLQLHGGVHRLYINDVYLGRGFDRSTVTIDQLSTTTRPVEVHISNMALITQMQDIVLRPELSYRIESVFYRDSIGGRFEVEDSGSIEFDGLVNGGGRRFVKMLPSQ